MRHYINLVTCILVYIENVYGNCTDEGNVDTSSRDEYKIQTAFVSYSIDWHKFNELINSCEFGKLHNIFDRNACFDHCSLRENCVAVELSVTGCHFGLIAEYDSSRIDQADLSITYVKTSEMEGTD